MTKDCEIIKRLIRTRDIENLDNEIIYITKKRLQDFIKECYPYMSIDSLVIKNNRVLNHTFYGKELEIINDDTIVIGGFSLGVVHND